ncbi:MAG: hypothetical protein EXR79_04590 [Myxococcales bacterium]|nr:hypothetical protein [Myxococcales bacterium]
MKPSTVLLVAAQLAALVAGCATPLPAATGAAAGGGDATLVANADAAVSDANTQDTAGGDSANPGAANPDAVASDAKAVDVPPPAADAAAADTIVPGPDAALPVDAAEPTCAAKFGTPTDKKVSTSGIYTVELDGPLQAAPGTLQPYQIRVTAGAAGEAVVQQAISVTYIHTQMGHGGLKTPSIEELCKGIYKVKNVQPSMGGTWALGFTLAKSDVVKFSIIVKN